MVSTFILTCFDPTQLEYTIKGNCVKFQAVNTEKKITVKKKMQYRKFLLVPDIAKKKSTNHYTDISNRK